MKTLLAFTVALFLVGCEPSKPDPRQVAPGDASWTTVYFNNSGSVEYTYPNEFSYRIVKLDGVDYIAVLGAHGTVTLCPKIKPNEK